MDSRSNGWDEYRTIPKKYLFSKRALGFPLDAPKDVSLCRFTMPLGCRYGPQKRVIMPLGCRYAAGIFYWGGGPLRFLVDFRTADLKV